MVGSTEILIIGAVVLVLFGAGAIPKFARSLGRARKEFEEGAAEEDGPESQQSGKTDEQSGAKEDQSGR